MSVQPAIRCDQVTKQFHVFEDRASSLRQVFIRTLKRQPIHVKSLVFTLRDFTLDVERGEAVALIGPNGSGKSTALRLIAGIYAPTRGVIETRGRLAAVIELGAGFHPELTGAENVELYAAVMGISRADLKTVYPEIVRFAGVSSFMDVPLKYYSSGMQARLAFAVTVCVDPEILLIDEVLAVGDRRFREKCLTRLERFRAQGGTLIVVSHDLDTVERICSRAVWLDQGRIRMSGPLAEVRAAYEEASS